VVCESGETILGRIKAPPKADQPQTTYNACGTIAMMNIIMNLEGLGLDDRLSTFKQETQVMTSPQRGAHIDTSTWIRTAHNSFSR
jgi:ubiquitin carboxyl-terminal hydrolase L5